MTPDFIEHAIKTAALLKSVGDPGCRLNSKAKVRYANRHGNGVTFAFGDRVYIVQAYHHILVIKA